MQSVKASNVQFPLLLRVKLETNVLKKVITRRIFTSRQLLEIKTIQSPNFGKADETYFDFKELEWNGSYQQRVQHFMALMCEIFKLSEQEAEHIVEYYPFLWKESFHKTFAYLKSKGLEKETFMQYPWLVSISPEEINSKIDIISKTFNDLQNVNACACLLKFPNVKIEKLVSNWKMEAMECEHPSKFHFLAHALKVPIAEIMNQLETKSFLVSMSYLRIQEGVNICLEAGVEKEDLLNDLWVLRNRPVKLRNRIETLQQSKIPVKPWVLRARIESFKTHIQEYWKERKEIELDHNLSSYLVTRLKCDPSVVARMMKVFPNLQRATIRKVKPNMDFLLIDKCVDPSLIIMTPRLLCIKLDTLKDRLEQLEKNNIQYASLWMIVRCQRHFDDYIKRWEPKRN
ncbi:hypothetical protein DAPPUDRAFT_317695 [Daphnia pulex]|uniref:Uncharacterized protein n=1 Tax=Daphnia pulex TaxID=6669 RepID=E9GGQ1_DAPPU|nr:hypothetical protein DAPPUDRAFT_317695 [Daphnia pulex]|eukprot:EFX81448.1 hypothetical protein DAPPUDRAFT_317695 [Daphnia pulex]